jgi:predicted DsbA family dithiol-disulfide isomerase
MASEHIIGEMVEVSEFPQLAVKYGVSGVPQTVINETVQVQGAVPESELARKILEAIGEK